MRARFMLASRSRFTRYRSAIRALFLGLYRSLAASRPLLISFCLFALAADSFMWASSASCCMEAIT
ncbi:hypothetical protein B0675_39330 [Streptomyces sp. M41(2017)]|nr:hypothetical protein B0675_39330 [Streptomyces sp. M41(2017)]